ncbi:hypothetical protein Ahia01_000605500 [Argonauta hians]
MHCTKTGKLAVLSIVILVTLILLCYFYLNHKSGHHFTVSTSQMFHYPQAAITSDSPLCSHMAIKSKKNIILDATARPPQQVTGLMNMSHLTGPSSVTVPGQVYGLWKAHQMYGLLPWKQLFEPTIRLATHGYNVSHLLAVTLGEMEGRIKSEPHLRELYINKTTGEVYQEGDCIKHPRLARTLQIIAEEGHLAVYNGSLSQHIIDDLTNAGPGSVVTLRDLSSYNVTLTTPLSTTLANGDTILVPPPPSMAVIMQLMLNVLDLYDFKPTTRSNLNLFATALHRIIETFKLAFAETSGLQDTVSDGVTQLSLLTNLTSREKAMWMKSQISDLHCHPTGFYDPSALNIEGTGATHVNGIGPDGIAVAVSSSLNHRFGSQIVGKKTGILFNNGMAAFSSRQNIPGTLSLHGATDPVEPRMAPLSYMSPTLITDIEGNIKLVIGATAGTKTLTSLSYVLSNVMWFNATIKEAIDSLRIHAQTIPTVTNSEDHLPQKVLHTLVKLGHNITSYGPPSFVHGIFRKNGTFLVNADYRAGAIPAGF